MIIQEDFRDFLHFYASSAIKIYFCAISFSFEKGYEILTDTITFMKYLKSFEV